MAIDDELNILPLTQSIKDIKPVKLPGQKDVDSDDNEGDKELKVTDLYLTAEQKKLKDLKYDLRDTKPIGNLVGMCKTYD